MVAIGLWHQQRYKQQNKVQLSCHVKKNGDICSDVACEQTQKNWSLSGLLHSYLEIQSSENTTAILVMSVWRIINEEIFKNQPLPLLPSKKKKTCKKKYDLKKKTTFFKTPHIQHAATDKNISMENSPGS